MAFYIVLIFTLITCVTSIDPPFSACHKDDVACLSTAAETFFAYSHAGIKELDIKPIDPLAIAPSDVVDEEKTLTIHFNNTVLTGLKNLKISDIKLDTDKKTVSVQMKGDLSIVSDVGVELTKTQKTFSGHYAASGYVISTSDYSYSIVEVHGTQHFEVGPEKNTCEIVTEPKLSLKIDLKDEADKEEYAKMPDLDKSALRKKTVCEFVNSATATIIHNLRAAAKAFPKEAFFKDL